MAFFAFAVAPLFCMHQTHHLLWQLSAWCDSDIPHTYQQACSLLTIVIQRWFCFKNFCYLLCRSVAVEYALAYNDCDCLANLSRLSCLSHMSTFHNIRFHFHSNLAMSNNLFIFIGILTKYWLQIIINSRSLNKNRKRNSHADLYTLNY